MKVKIVDKYSGTIDKSYEDEINEFIEGKKIIDIKSGVSDNQVTYLILYEDN